MSARRLVLLSLAMPVLCAALAAGIVAQQYARGRSLRRDLSRYHHIARGLAAASRASTVTHPHDHLNHGEH
ncbi:MAG: hypothetical protein IT208_09680 [Chthonomonadales bacterium]|nr:hypothetical protein [Chthonomonadales bacterium]